MSDRAQLYNDAEEAQRLVLDGRQATIWTAIPGIVQSVNFSAMTVEVQPSIQGTIENENGTIQSVNLPLLVDVPIVFPSAGGFTITFPIVVGDEVLVVFSSRCIDAWWQSGGIQRPMEARMHDLSDGFAIPGPRSQPRVVPGISNSAMQIRNDAGTSYIEIDDDGKINLVSPSEVNLTAPIVKVTGGLIIDGTVTGVGMSPVINIESDINITGSIDASGDVVASGISLNSHTHPQSGGGNTGAPNP